MKADKRRTFNADEVKAFLPTTSVVSACLPAGASAGRNLLDVASSTYQVRDEPAVGDQSTEERAKNLGANNSIWLVRLYRNESRNLPEHIEITINYQS